jgi:hypothetical protein
LQLHSISVRQAHISAIEASHDQDKRCKDTMKTKNQFRTVEAPRKGDSKSRNANDSSDNP